MVNGIQERITENVILPLGYQVEYGGRESSAGYGTPNANPSSGEHLAEQLHVLDMSAAEVARRLDVPTNRVTSFLDGQRAITGDTARRLAHFFGSSPEFWLNLQHLYELRDHRLRARRIMWCSTFSHVLNTCLYLGFRAVSAD